MTGLKIVTKELTNKLCCSSVMVMVVVAMAILVHLDPPNQLPEYITYTHALFIKSRIGLEYNFDSVA